MRRLMLAAAVLVVMPVSTRADLIVGHATYGGGLGFPFSLAYTGEFQQVYSALEFRAVPGGVETITALSFATISDFNVGPANPQTITLTVSLSTTSTSPATLSTDFVANRGADNVVVFSGTLTYRPSRDFTIDFTIPTSTYVYNPAHGNLLVDVNVTSGAGSVNTPPTENFFAAAGDSTIATVYLQQFGNPGDPRTAVVEPFGLVTEFGATQGVNVLGVPEPGSVVLLGLGVVGLFAARRRYNVRWDDRQTGGSSRGRK